MTERRYDDISSFEPSRSLVDALRIATQPQQPKEERGMLLPIMRRGDDLSLALPGFLHEPITAMSRLLASGYHPGINDTDTIKDALSVATSLAGTGTAFNALGIVPKGSAGIFGGRLGAQRLAEAGIAGPRNALDLAERLHARGAALDEIRSATNNLLANEAPAFGGVHLGRDGKWRFEIDDSAMGVRPSADWKPVTEHFPHPILEQAYPEARSIDSMVAVGDGSKRAAGWAEDLGTPNAMMMVRTPTTDQARQVASHELQHAVQAVEGFEPGTTPAAVKQAPLFQQFVQRLRQSHEYQAGTPAQQEAAETALAVEIYRRTAGESEAMNVTNRLHLTPEQRRATPPASTSPVPEAGQFLRNDLWLAR